MCLYLKNIILYRFTVQQQSCDTNRTHGNRMKIWLLVSSLESSDRLSYYILFRWQLRRSLRQKLCRFCDSSAAAASSARQRGGPSAFNMLRISNFSKRQWLTLIVFSIADFCNAICVSLQAPFYPQEVRTAAFNAKHNCVRGQGEGEHWSLELYRSY